MGKLPLLFFRLMISRILLGISFGAFTIFYLWYIVFYFKEVFLTGMVPTIYLASSLIVSVPIGHLLDKFNSTKIGFYASLMAMLPVIILFFQNSLEFIYISTAILSVAFTMKGDSFSASTKKHLDETQFHSASSYTFIASNVSSLSGTLIGGVCVSYFPQYFIYILTAIVILSISLSLPTKEISNSKSDESRGSGIISSISFYKKMIGFLLVGFTINGLFESLDVYSSGLFHLVLHSQPIYYTMFVVVISIGGISGSFVTKTWPSIGSNGKRISFFIFLFSPILLGIGISPSPFIDIILSFSLGILLPLINVPLTAKLMAIVPREIFGKVMAFLRIFISGSTPLMAAFFSFVSLWSPVNFIFIYIGLIMIPVTALSFAVIPKFLSIQSGNALENPV